MSLYYNIKCKLALGQPYGSQLSNKKEQDPIHRVIKKPLSNKTLIKYGTFLEIH